MFFFYYFQPVVICFHIPLLLLKVCFGSMGTPVSASPGGVVRMEFFCEIEKLFRALKTVRGYIPWRSILDRSIAWVMLRNNKHDITRLEKGNGRLESGNSRSAKCNQQRGQNAVVGLWLELVGDCQLTL
jgi:hypothetical protein